MIIRLFLLYSRGLLTPIGRSGFYRRRHVKMNRLSRFLPLCRLGPIGNGTVLFLDLQVRHTPNSLRSQDGIRRFFQKSLIALQGLIQTAFYFFCLDFDMLITQFGNRIPATCGLAGGQHHRQNRKDEQDPVH